MAPLVTAIREPQRGGSQAFVSDLARGLAGRGHDVHVYAASGSEIPGVEVVDTGIDPRSLAGTLYRASGPAAGEPGEAGAASAALLSCAIAEQLRFGEDFKRRRFERQTRRGGGYGDAELEPARQEGREAVGIRFR